MSAYIGMELPLTPQASVLRGKFYMPFYINASKLFYWLLLQQPNQCFEKNACADRKYLLNENLGYDHLGDKKMFSLCQIYNLKVA